MKRKKPDSIQKHNGNDKERAMREVIKIFIQIFFLSSFFVFGKKLNRHQIFPGKAPGARFIKIYLDISKSSEEPKEMKA